MRRRTGTWPTILTMLLLLGATELAAGNNAGSEEIGVVSDGRLANDSTVVIGRTSSAGATGSTPVIAANDKVQYIVVLKKDKEKKRPDFVKHEADIEAEWGQWVLVRISPNKLDKLLEEEKVKFVQRIMPVEEAQDVQRRGASKTGSGETVMSTGIVDTVSSTPANWSTGTYAYDGAGNVKTIGSEQFYYDRLGRLVKATFRAGAGNLTETYIYDVYGNLSGRTGAAKSVGAIGVDTRTNRMNAALYDGAGNMKEFGAFQHQFDPVSMMREYTSGGLQLYHVYNADDERIGTKDNGQSHWTWTVRGPDGKVHRTYESAYGNESTMIWYWREDNVYRGAALLGTERPVAEGGKFHYHLDHLGTPRQITSQYQEQYAKNDYYPFGTSAAVSGMAVRGYASNSLQFTGHERDYASAATTDNSDYLDYMHARYYNPHQGRFLSVDPVINQKRAMTSPQGWNRYAYVSNNPVNAVDPDGRDELGFANKLGTIETDEDLHEIALGSAAGAGAGLSMAGGATGMMSLLGRGGLAAGAFNLPSVIRGMVIESALAAKFGGGLPGTFKTIDRFLNGVATSVKSVDLAAKTYQNVARLNSLLTGYVDKLSRFNGATVGRVSVQGADITRRVLEVAIQKGVANRQQVEAISKATEYAKKLGVEVRVVEIK